MARHIRITQRKRLALIAVVGGVAALSASGLAFAAPVSTIEADCQSAPGAEICVPLADAATPVNPASAGVETAYQPVDSAAPGAAPNVRRSAGADRYETNYQVNLNEMKAGKPLFVATGAAFPDALSVGPAVALNDGALILAPKRGLDQRTLELIQSRRPSTVYVIGGTGAVPTSVATEIGNAAGRTVKRVGGADRYETSAKILTEFFSAWNVPSAFIATGRDYPDALSAAAVGGALELPVLLVNGKSPNAKLAASSVALLRSKGVGNLVVVGGTGVVTPRAVSNVAAQGPFDMMRVAGNDRYATNIAVNDFLNGQTGGTSGVSRVWIATGKNFPDALSAGAPAGTTSQRLVLSNGKCIPKPVVSSWIMGPGSQVSEVELVGGTGVLASSVAALTQCS